MRRAGRVDRVVFAGVDYAAILAIAEAEADILVWDGGNNDFAEDALAPLSAVIDAFLRRLPAAA